VYSLVGTDRPSLGTNCALLVWSGDYAEYIFLAIRLVRRVTLAVDINVDMITPGDL